MSSDEVNRSELYFSCLRHNPASWGSNGLDADLIKRLSDPKSNHQVISIHCLCIIPTYHSSSQSTMECWVVPDDIKHTIGNASARNISAYIGRILLSQFRRSSGISFHDHLEKSLSHPKPQELMTSVKEAKAADKLMFFHYIGHGSKIPTEQGEFHIIDNSGNNFYPFDIGEFVELSPTRAVYVFDVSAARRLQAKFERSVGGKEKYAIFACAADEELPSSNLIPADILTSCLSTPLKMSIAWCIHNSPLLEVNPELISSASDDDLTPGTTMKIESPARELQYLFASMMEAIAGAVLPDSLYTKLFKGDILVAGIFRNYILADRILRSLGCSPSTVPEMPSCADHPLWQFWDTCIETYCMNRSITSAIFKSVLDFSTSHRINLDRRSYDTITLNLTAEQQSYFALNNYMYTPLMNTVLSSFSSWLEQGSYQRTVPAELPILFTGLRFEPVRIQASELIARFVDLGVWAIDDAVRVSIYSYLSNFIWDEDPIFRHNILFIWTKLLSADSQNAVAAFMAAMKKEVSSVQSRSRVSLSSQSSPINRYIYLMFAPDTNMAEECFSPTVSDSQQESGVPPDTRWMCAFILTILASREKSVPELLLSNKLLEKSHNIFASALSPLRLWYILLLFNIFKNWTPDPETDAIVYDNYIDMIDLSIKGISDVSPEVRAASLDLFGILTTSQWVRDSFTRYGDDYKPKSGTWAKTRKIRTLKTKKVAHTFYLPISPLHILHRVSFALNDVSPLVRRAYLATISSIIFLCKDHILEIVSNAVARERGFLEVEYTFETDLLESYNYILDALGSIISDPLPQIANRAALLKFSLQAIATLHHIKDSPHPDYIIDVSLYQNFESGADMQRAVNLLARQEELPDNIRLDVIERLIEEYEAAFDYVLPMQTNFLTFRLLRHTGSAPLIPETLERLAATAATLAHRVIYVCPEHEIARDSATQDMYCSTGCQAKEKGCILCELVQTAGVGITGMAADAVFGHPYVFESPSDLSHFLTGLQSNTNYNEDYPQSPLMKEDPDLMPQDPITISSFVRDRSKSRVSRILDVFKPASVVTKSLTLPNDTKDLVPRYEEPPFPMLLLAPGTSDPTDNELFSNFLHPVKQKDDKKRQLSISKDHSSLSHKSDTVSGHDQTNLIQSLYRVCFSIIDSAVILVAMGDNNDVRSTLDCLQGIDSTSSVAPHLTFDFTSFIPNCLPHLPDQSLYLWKLHKKDTLTKKRLRSICAERNSLMGLKTQESSVYDPAMSRSTFTKIKMHPYLPYVLAVDSDNVLRCWDYVYKQNEPKNTTSLYQSCPSITKYSVSEIELINSKSANAMAVLSCDDGAIRVISKYDSAMPANCVSAFYAHDVDRDVLSSKMWSAPTDFLKASYISTNRPLSITKRSDIFSNPVQTIQRSMSRLNLRRDSCYCYAAEGCSPSCVATLTSPVFYQRYFNHMGVDLYSGVIYNSYNSDYIYQYELSTERIIRKVSLDGSKLNSLSVNDKAWVASTSSNTVHYGPLGSSSSTISIHEQYGVRTTKLVSDYDILVDSSSKYAIWDIRNTSAGIPKVETVNARGFCNRICAHREASIIGRCYSDCFDFSSIEGHIISSTTVSDAFPKVTNIHDYSLSTMTFHPLELRAAVAIQCGDRSNIAIYSNANSYQAQ